MQCQRHSLCRAHNAFNPAAALLGVLTPDFSTGSTRKRWQTTVLAHADASSTSSHSAPPLEDNDLPNSLLPATEDIFPAKTAPIAETSTSNESLIRAVKPWKRPFSDLDRLVGKKVSRYLASDWRTGDPNSWQVHMQMIAQALGNLRMRKDGKPLHEVPLAARQLMDYKELRVWVPPKLRCTISSEELRRIREAGGDRLSSLKRLNSEIRSAVDYATLTKYEKAGRRAVIRETLDFVEESNTAEGLKAELFGSEKMDIATTASDIDIRLFRESPNGSTNGNTDDGSVKKQMIHLAAKMLETRKFQGVVLRKSASWPIINAQHTHSGITIQIVASPSSSYAREAIAQRYLTEIPHLRPIYSLVRTALGIRSLIDVFYGGLGSYPTLIWLATMMKSPRYAQYIQRTDGSLASHLLTLLRCIKTSNLQRFGYVAEPASAALPKHDMTPAGLEEAIASTIALHESNPQEAQRQVDWLKISQRSKLLPYLLCLQDPADPTNDLGRRCYAIKHIMATTDWIHRNLLIQMMDHDERLSKGLEGKNDYWLDMLIGDLELVYGQRRRRIEAYGRSARRPRSSNPTLLIKEGMHASVAVNIAGPGRLYG